MKNDSWHVRRDRAQLEGPLPKTRTATGPRSQRVKRISIAEVCADRRPGHALRAGTARAPGLLPPVILLHETHWSRPPDSILDTPCALVHPARHSFLI